MKTLQKYTTALFLGALIFFSQHELSAQTEENKFTVSVEPGIGISPMPIMDMTLSNIIQVGINKRLSVISYTSIRENNLFLRNFNYIKSTDNHTLTQKLGIGWSVYTKRSNHTFSLLGGIKYDTYHESLNNPKFEKVDVQINALSPDVGLMYNLKFGQKKYFFSYRMYIPLTPYPFKTRDFNAFDGNVNNVSLEFGIGFRLNTTTMNLSSIPMPAGLIEARAAQKKLTKRILKSWYTLIAVVQE